MATTFANNPNILTGYLLRVIRGIEDEGKIGLISIKCSIKNEPSKSHFYPNSIDLSDPTGPSTPFPPHQKTAALLDKLTAELPAQLKKVAVTLG